MLSFQILVKCHNISWVLVVLEKKKTTYYNVCNACQSGATASIGIANQRNENESAVTSGNKYIQQRNELDVCTEEALFNSNC
jgi:hypothetical protein